MNQKQYNNYNQRGVQSTVNKDFIANIKANHFDYGDTRPKSALQIQNHYQSLTKSNFNFKGDAQVLRSKLDEAKRNDLRRNHF